MKAWSKGVCGDVLRARVYSNKEIVKVADAIFASAVSYCARNLPAENPLLFSILHLILDKNAAYYVSNGKEGNYQEFPFGEQLPPDQETLEWLAKLQVGGRRGLPEEPGLPQVLVQGRL
jgi:hypothetical protein